METFKNQEDLARDLYQMWLEGKRHAVRTMIRNPPDNRQIGYAAAAVTSLLPEAERILFVDFIHPNNW